MAAREYLRLTKEAVWGTYNSSAVAADIAIIQLNAPNSFTVRPRPNYWTERSAGGSNRPVLTGTSTQSVAGKFTTKLFPSQTKLLCGLAINVAVPGGGILLDLLSFTADHAIVFDDGSAKVFRRYLGCKFGSTTISASNAQNPNVVFSADVTGWKPATITATDFPEPAYGTAPTYPTDNPFQFKQVAGAFTLGAARTSLKQFTLTVGNELRAPFDENTFVSSVKWTGRANKLDVDFRFLSNVDRAAYEAATPEACSVALTDGVSTATFQMNAANFTSGVEDDLAWGDPGMYQKVTAMNYLDPAATPVTDLLFSFAP